jgi:hypothetical protein
MGLALSCNPARKKKERKKERKKEKIGPSSTFCRHMIF